MLYPHQIHTLCMKIFVIHAPRGKGLISSFYQCFTLDSKYTKLFYMLKCEEELREQFMEQEWDLMWTNLRKCTRSLSVRDTALKIFTRWQYTSFKLSTIYPQASPHCFQRYSQVGFFLHTFWTCENMSSFGAELFDFMSKLVGKLITLFSPNVYYSCIFQISPDPWKD